MATHLHRLINPQSICLFGSGWAENVARQLAKAEYQGQVFVVHPHRDALAGIRCVRSVAELPVAPDASFVGLNRQASVDVVKQLAERGAGGAVCFASGFQESDLSDGATLQSALVAAAGQMPILGPNCYGYINYLDSTPVWPDEYGGFKVESGVAIIAQSSNIALNMTMQQRGLRIAYLFTLGNQAQTQVSDLIDAMVADNRVTSIGLYLEGFGDITRFCQAALAARAANKPIVALKVGKTQKARLATQTHTATMAGGSAASSALLLRLGVVEVDTVSVFLETLKLLDRLGPMAGSAVASISSSGGEVSLMADLAQYSRLQYPDFSDSTVTKLKHFLGEKVTIANPLDYHTYIWGDIATMTECFKAVVESPFDLHVFVLDIPRADHCDPQGHDCAITAICNSAQALQEQGITPTIAVVALLPENLSENVVQRFANAGVVTLHGIETAIAAIDASIRAGQMNEVDARLPWLTKIKPDVEAHLVDEYSAKQTLAAFGLPIPSGVLISTQDELDQATQSEHASWVLKVVGLAHKTEVGGVRLNLTARAELHQAFSILKQLCDSASISGDGRLLLEKQVESPIAEMLVGVSRDETGLLLLTVGAGGIYTEILNDVCHLVLPTNANAVKHALSELKMTPLLQGYRGKPKANIDSIVTAIMAVDTYVSEHTESLLSLDINPLMVTASEAIAVDALIETV